MKWEDDIYDILANIHPVEIISGVLKPAIIQLIEDYEDGLTHYDKETEQDQIKMTKELIKQAKKVKVEIVKLSK